MQVHGDDQMHHGAVCLYCSEAWLILEFLAGSKSVPAIHNLVVLRYKHRLPKLVAVPHQTGSGKGGIAVFGYSPMMRQWRNKQTRPIWNRVGGPLKLPCGFKSRLHYPDPLPIHRGG